MPDDHSEVVPLLPIPNRTVKRLCADDSAGPRVKVGHRQASIALPRLKPKALTILSVRAFAFGGTENEAPADSERLAVPS